MLITLLVVCRLRCAGFSRGRLASSGGFGRLGGLGSLSGLSGLVGSGVGSAVRSASRGAVRGAVRGAGLCLQSRATAADTLYRGWVQKSQETRAVGDVVVGGGRVCMTLVK